MNTDCHTILKLLVDKTFLVRPTLYTVIGLSVSLKTCK